MERLSDALVQQHKETYQKIVANPYGNVEVREHASDLVAALAELQELRKNAPASH